MSQQLPATDDPEALTPIADAHRLAQQTGEVFEGTQHSGTTHPSHQQIFATSYGRD
jgi:hypothetical protein